MKFYHDLIVQKSWRLLQSLRKKYDFILIGGWAVFLYARSLKSKDIDLVLEFNQLEKLKNDFPVTKNNRLKKYEAKSEGLEIDIYVPHYSSPGLPAEELAKFTTSLSGFKTIEPEVLVILKQKALLSRKDSLKGRKDLLDIFGLFSLVEFNWQRYQQIIKKYQLQLTTKEIEEIIKKTHRLPEINLNPHQMARFKKKILPNLYAINLR